MPNIRVSDDIYSKLKAFADRDLRSVANATEFLLSLQLGDNGVPADTPYQRPGGAAPSGKVDDLFPAEKKSEPSATRGKGEILADIRSTEADRDEELRNCQDPETSLKITNRYAGTIDGLWKEYHANTNA